MTEEVQQTETQEVEQGNAEETTQETPVEINQRLLRESKENKLIAAQYKADLEALKQSELERNGTLEERLESEKSHRLKLEKELSKTKGQQIESRVESLLAKHAKDALDLDDLLRHPLSREIISYDESTGVVDETSVEEAVQLLRQKKPNYFTKEKARTQMNQTPSDKAPENTKKYGQLNGDEKNRLKSQLIKKKFN